MCRLPERCLEPYREVTLALACMQCLSGRRVSSQEHAPNNVLIPLRLGSS